MHRRLLETVFNGDTFDYSFTLVRHPVERFVSEYKFQVAASKRPDFAPIAEWIEDLPTKLPENPFAFDNHLRPQHEFI